jgi:hypothetical protein
LLVSPIVLGKGHPAFENSSDRLSLSLAKVEPWSSGIVAIFYRQHAASRP